MLNAADLNRKLINYAFVAGWIGLFAFTGAVICASERLIGFGWGASFGLLTLAVYGRRLVDQHDYRNSLNAVGDFTNTKSDTACGGTGYGAAEAQPDV